MNLSDGFIKKNSFYPPGLSEFFLKSYFPGINKMDIISERHAVYRRWQTRETASWPFSGLAEVIGKLHAECKHTRGRQWTGTWQPEIWNVREENESINLTHFCPQTVREAELLQEQTGVAEGIINRAVVEKKSDQRKTPLAVYHSFKQFTYLFIWPSRF